MNERTVKEHPQRAKRQATANATARNVEEVSVGKRLEGKLAFSQANGSLI